jgi:CRP-like cAMP-binding protein
MNIGDIINIIESNPYIYELMKYCPYEILKRWDYREYSSGSIICNQGERYDLFFVIVKGYINIYYMAENGKKYIQSIYKEGNFIGELEIFDRKPYICFVESLSDTKLLQLNQKYFLEWLTLDRYAHSFITKEICKQFYDLSQKAAEDTLYSLKKRICNYLLSFCLNKIDSIPIRINLEKEQLSEMFAVTSRSVNRILKHLKEEGAIEIKPESIIIKSPSLLSKEEKKSLYD